LREEKPEMSKKPRLALVKTTETFLEPPRSLHKAGAAMWTSIMQEYRIEDSGGQAMLEQICQAADRVQEFTAIISREGLVVRTKQGPRDHPLLRHEQAARSFIIRSLHRLGLDVEPLRPIGRPSSSGSLEELLDAD
jgi:hypothetical protein